MAQKAIEFKRNGSKLLLAYSPRDDDTWVHAKFARGEELVVKGTYHLRKAHLLEGGSPIDELYGGEPLLFVIAELEGRYYVFDEEILPVGCKILIHTSVPIDWKWFTAEKKVSIFGVIAQLGLKRIVVGGQEKDAIPVREFQKLINQFPTPIELKRYVQARVSAVVREYTETKEDAEKKYKRYLNRRIKRPAKDLIGEFRENEVQKYRKLLKRLRSMLVSEQTYSEAVWQQEILQIFLLLYPKYIKAIKEARIRDTDNAATKKIDMLLVDATGNIDIVEIKKPFGKCIVTDGRYRDNHIPLRELSGTVMQIEKYIFCLNRWGVNGEKALTAKYKSDFPQDFSIKITNPCGVIIMGRDFDLSAAQKRDFEVVKRKYKNVVDIITYDDLLRRLEAVIKHFSRS